MVLWFWVSVGFLLWMEHLDLGFVGRWRIGSGVLGGLCWWLP